MTLPELITYWRLIGVLRVVSNYIQSNIDDCKVKVQISATHSLYVTYNVRTLVPHRAVLYYDSGHVFKMMDEIEDIPASGITKRICDWMEKHQ